MAERVCAGANMCQGFLKSCETSQDSLLQESVHRRQHLEKVFRGVEAQKIAIESELQDEILGRQ